MLSMRQTTLPSMHGSRRGGMLGMPVEAVDDQPDVLADRIVAKDA